MGGIADSSVTIQTSAQSVPSTPSWFGETAVIAQYLRRLGVLSEISEHVRFARSRFGHYDLIDFAVVLLGYAISGERTLEAFYERLQSFANVFMALFKRDRLPHRSTLSRFLAALNQTAVESLRTLFLKDLLARPLEKEEKPGGLWDRLSMDCHSGHAHHIPKDLPEQISLYSLHALRDTRRLCHFSRPPHRLSLAYRSRETGAVRYKLFARLHNCLSYVLFLVLQ